MKIGISTFVNDDSIDTLSLARAIEERGFDSLVVAEHTHIPASRETPYPQGGELPPVYYRTLDPFGTTQTDGARFGALRWGLPGGGPYPGWPGGGM